MPGIAEPAPARDRIMVLDVLRGVAVGGILLANTFVFFGLFLIPPERAAAFSTHSLDRIVEFAEHVLVEGKFYSIFSLLFGIGFGLQLARGGDASVPRFRRRLSVLLLIGAVHALLIWAGDILLLYALLGFSMPWFAKKDARSLLRWTIGLLATPTILYVVAVIAFGLVGGSEAPAAGPAQPDLPPDIFERLAAMGTGGPDDALIGNLIFFVGRWMDLFVSVRFPKVLGMFVLGLWTVRQGITTDLQSHLGLLRRWRMAGLTIGLAANLIAAVVFLSWPYLPPSAMGLLGVFAQAIGFPLLAIGYACTIAIAWPRVHVLGLFGPVGRMALTNYLMHSVVCVTLSYGFGLGWWWRIGAASTWLVAVTIIAVQIPLSRWWLTSYQYGPAEWVWRRLTYGVPLPMRRR